jgi:hypothetical protein
MPAVFWQIDLQRALTSGRGQRILLEIEAALLVMPEHRLIADQIAHVVDWNEDGDPLETPRVIGVCAVGAYAAHKRVAEGKTWTQAVADLSEEYPYEVDCYETQELGQSLGLARTVAWELARINDETFGHLAPEDRYAAVLAWVRERIKPEVAS